MIELMLVNALAYSEQIAILAVVAALLCAMLRMTPGVRLYCLQGVLLCALILPFVQPWRVNRSKARVTFATAVLAEGPAQNARPETWTPSVSELIAFALLGGVIARLGFLAIGVVRLRGCMNRSRLEPSALIGEKARVGVAADVFVSDELRGPVTFGLWRPAILIPPRWLGNATVAYHELLHVRRNDWAFAIAEEMVRAALWFHPAIWWLISQIQLAREQVVDRQAVHFVESRESYLTTLLTIAEAKAGLDLAPAQLFLKKRHLRQRVAILIKEVTMSKIRMTWSLAGFAAAMMCAGWLSIHSFPLEAAPQDKDSPGVTVHADEMRLLHREAVRYPEAALEKGIQGTVIVEATLDQNGEVSGAQVLSGPDELRHAALESIVKWHYEKPVTAAQKVQIAVDFVMPPDGPTKMMRSGAPSTAVKIARIDLGQVPQPLRDRLAGELPMKVGDGFSADRAAEFRSHLAAIDRHLYYSLRVSPDGTTASMTITFSSESPGQPSRIRVGGNVQAANLINKVVPVYPPDAKAARIQGTVRFMAAIGKDGHMISLDLVSGHPVLVEAAREAVLQWVYKPTLLNGNPVEVLTAIDVNFTLSE